MHRTKPEVPEGGISPHILPCPACPEPSALAQLMQVSIYLVQICLTPPRLAKQKME